ncbi:helix-turn-helix domain-containing protein, partial [Vibrio sinaloensis]|uniref:helix-turn-helix domain-containing protein n=2 Tax=Vibrionaceae TaxID=641 RepID=UPI002F40F672
LNPTQPIADSIPLATQVAEFEKTLIEQALASNHGKINETLDTLQLARKTLYDKMQKYGIDKNSYKTE